MTTQSFRIYNFDSKGKPGAPMDIVFDDAIEAVDYANRQRKAAQIELWKGSELIARLRAMASPPVF